MINFLIQLYLGLLPCNFVFSLINKTVDKHAMKKTNKPDFHILGKVGNSMIELKLIIIKCFIKFIYVYMANTVCYVLVTI